MTDKSETVPIGLAASEPAPLFGLRKAWSAIQAVLEPRLGRRLGAGSFAAASIGALAVYAAGAVLAYLTQLAVARAIGPDGFGIFAYVMAWTTLLAYFSTLGFHVSLLRFLSTYRTRGQWPLARGALAFAQRSVALIGLGVAVIGCAAVLALGHRMSSELSAAFLIGMAAVPVIALHLVSAAAVRAFGGVLSAIVPERLVRDSVVLLVVVAGIWTSLAPADGRLAMGAALAGALATLALLRYQMRRQRPAELSGSGPPAQVTPAEWWRPTLPLTVIMVADNLMCRSGIIVLGLAASTRDAGIFAVAYSLALLTTLPRMAVATVFAPTVSALHAREDRAGLQSLAAKAALLSLGGTVCAVVPLLLVVAPLLGWFGPDFVEGAPIVGILVLGHLLSAACGPQQHLITMTANEPAGARIFAAAAALNLAGCIALVGPLGMTGVAIAQAASLVAWNLAMAHFIRRKLGLEPGLFSLLVERGNARKSKHGVFVMADAGGALVVDTAGPIEASGTKHQEDAVVAATQEPSKAIIRTFIAALEQRGIRYCHWKSNIRLADALSGAEDVDLLVAREDADHFQETLLAHGFRLARSRGEIDHPGVFHAIGLDVESGQLVHVHAYTQIVTGDSLVKSYRLPVEEALLDNTRHVDGVRIPSPEAGFVLFALRFALKHVSLVEIMMANRSYAAVIGEFEWLQEAADETRAAELCSRLLPSIEPELFQRLLAAIGARGTVLQRIALGWRVAARLASRRRLGPVSAATSRLWRVLVLMLGRFNRRKDLVLLSGGRIIAFVGPKATGKSTLTNALAERLGQHLDVEIIHAGKPPATAVSFLPRTMIPLARSLFRSERPGEYEKAERRQEKRYSLLYVLRMTLAAYDRRRLLLRAMRAATAGRIVISDRYPSDIAGAIDSSCFDDEALARCTSPLKRWLMQLERALYRSLPRPDLVVRLVAPLAATLDRDALRAKEGGPDAEALRRRWELETLAYREGARVVSIDTDQPLAETIRATVCSAWRAM